MTTPSEKIAQAVTTIVLDQPFYATLLLQMPRVEDPSVPTACTNGQVIRYSPTFIDSLTQSQVVGLLVHEVLHCALGHLWRLPHTKEANMAADHAVNLFLGEYNRSAGIRKIELPEGGLADPKYMGMSAEQILAALPKSPEQQSGGGSGDGQRTKEEGGWGEFEQPAASADGQTSAEDMRSEWERRLVQAATSAKMQGKLPGCIEALVDELVNPKVPWQQLLERFIDQTSANDYSWAKPDRRFLPDDIIVPDLHDETLGHIVVAVDTSGSIYGCPDTLASFESEINSIIDRCKPSKITIIYCDAAVAHVDEFTDASPIKLTPQGGGGTDFRPVGDYLRQHNINPRAVIYLTDLFGEFPVAEWPFPTLWCAYNNPNGVAPFGETIHIND